MFLRDLWPLVVVTLLLSCPAEKEQTPTLEFSEVTNEAGLTFQHQNGGTGSFNYPELMSAGVAFVDTDGDGLLDIYLVQGGELPNESVADTPSNRLFRNLGEGRFADVTDNSNTGDTRYGTGAIAADYDNDGDVDLYITNLGRNTLYRNDGDGSFTDVTDNAGVGGDRYSTAATFTDFDRDGDLDLYVANYIDWIPAIERDCYAPNGLRDYCSPGTYNRPARDTLYRNEGDGRFRDISVVVGIGNHPGAGLGVIATDLTGDDLVDFFVANDQMPNTLWVGNEKGSFTDEALQRGCALNEFGRSEASMGIALQDVDRDGDWDMFVTHLDGETNTFYRNDEGYFQDVTDRLMLGGVSRALTGFGTGFADFDCDGSLDIVIANGSVRLGDSMEAGHYGEPNQLLRGNLSGSFTDESIGFGSPPHPEVSRGLALGDYDNDGDIDILIGNNDGSPRLYQNNSCRNGHWLGIELVGTRPGMHGIGAIITLTSGEVKMWRQVQPAYGYGASHDPRIHFGLGDLPGPYTLDVMFPNGSIRSIVVQEADRYLRVDAN